MKKLNKNNKGFSLVELLVVIAIMVVLVGVIAPSLLSNIEKARESKDIQALDTIAGNVQAAMTNETVYDAIIKKAGTSEEVIVNLKKGYLGTAFSDTVDDAGKKFAASLNDSLNVSAVYDGASFKDTDSVAENIGDIKLFGGKIAKNSGNNICIKVNVKTGNITVFLSENETEAKTIKGKSANYTVTR